MDPNGQWREKVRASWRKVAGFRLMRPMGVLVLAILALIFLQARQVRSDAVTAFAAIATLAISQSFELAKRRSEERRWYAERFLTDKIAAVKHLYSALDDWYRAANYYGNLPSESLQQFRATVGAKEEPFLEALAFAQLYLSSDDDEVIRRSMSALRRANIAIYYALPDSAFPEGRPKANAVEEQFPWIEFVECHNAAKARLAALLNPLALRQIESELGTHANGR